MDFKFGIDRHPETTRNEPPPSNFQHFSVMSLLQRDDVAQAGGNEIRQQNYTYIPLEKN